MEETSDEKSEEKKTAAELQDDGHDRYDRKGRGDSNEIIPGCRTDSQNIPDK